MTDELFVRRSRMPHPGSIVFGWHERPGAFERLNPPWDPVRVVASDAGIKDGARVTLRAGLGPIGLDWTLEHRDYVPGKQFRDVQISGPFGRWQHTHIVEDDGPQASWLEDRIEYALPFGAAGRTLASAAVRRKLDSVFSFRHRTTMEDLAAHAAAGGSTMKVLVTGATGLVGTALGAFLGGGGHSVTRLVRRKSGRAGNFSADEIEWNPAAGQLDAGRIEGLDAVVHLAGDPIAEGRWNEAKKQRIRDSRVTGTRLLCETIARLKQPPKVLVCASAIGWYGDRGEEILAEDSLPGTGFLADVCREWEAACEPARARGVRVVSLRTGVVVSSRGGALKKMLTPFRLGLGGVVGSGDQWMSWIGLDDLVGVILKALTDDSLSGPVNAVAPQAVTNREFTKTLGRVLGRPTILPMPAFAARAAFGEMADALLLASLRIRPDRLEAAGYRFRAGDLESALKQQLGNG